MTETGVKQGEGYELGYLFTYLLIYSFNYSPIHYLVKQKSDEFEDDEELIF